MKLINFPVFLLIVLGISSAHSSTLNCRKTDGDGLGWLPDRFSLSISQDRKTLKILEGRSDAFGNPDFKKSLLGSDFWSRGKGETTSGQFRAYQIQLRLLDNDTKYKLSRKASGFYDIDVSGVCTTYGSSALTPRATKSSTAGKHSDDAKLFVKLSRCSNPAEQMNRAAENPDHAAIIVKGLGPDFLNELIEAEIIRPNALSNSILQFLASHHDKPISEEDRQIIVADHRRAASALADCFNVADFESAKLRAALLQGQTNVANLMLRLESSRDPITYEEWSKSSDSILEQFALVAMEVFGQQEVMTTLAPVLEESSQASLEAMINIYSTW